MRLEGRQRVGGHCSHLGDNKEVFDAEVYAISQALEVLDRRQKSGRRYTIFVDSTSGIDRIRTDSIGPGQGFAVAAIERCSRSMTRDNEVTTQWIPEHHGVAGKERADEYAKAAVEGIRPDSAVPDELRWETSLSHMTRAATEGRSRRVSQWIAEHLGSPSRRYRVPPGRGVRHKHLRRAPKQIASQLLSDHAAIGPYLKDKIRKTDDDRCWWCGEGSNRPGTNSSRSVGLGCLGLGGCRRI